MKRGDRVLIDTMVIIKCDPDKAAILSAHRLNFLDRVVALEDMALAAGIRKQGFGKNHTKNWLAEFKTKVLLGIL
jgi:hypothetical protein